MAVKKEHILGVGAAIAALAFLWYLLTKQEQAGASTLAQTTPQDLSTQIPPQQDSAPGYPNQPSNPASSVTFGGNPIYIDYNTPPYVPPSAIGLESVPTITESGISTPPEIAGTGGACCDCEGAGTASNWLSLTTSYPAGYLQTSADNLQGYLVRASA
jgi:hypothetical protein